MSQNIPNKIKENILKPLLESRKSEALNSMIRYQVTIENYKKANPKNMLANKRDFCTHVLEGPPAR